MKTSEHLGAIEEYTRSLLDKGFAYEKLRSVYFDLTKCKDYGALSKIDPKKIRLGTTVDLDAYEKLNPRDFTLLKRATLAELKRGVCMKTDWGKVLPSWHIAAAVAIHELGAPIDIQLSSLDFLFPHLENVREIGEALTGKPFANIWMLCERIWSARGKKDQDQMDETCSIKELLSRGYSPMELRYWLLNTHYRKPLHITEENIRHTANAYHRLQEFINRIQHARCTKGEQQTVGEMTYALEQGFFQALSDDLNTPQAIASLFRFAREMNPLLERCEFSEMQQKQILELLHKLNQVLGVFDLQLQALGFEEETLMKRREEARKSADWNEADRLRDELLARGIRVTDTPAGSRWEWVKRS
jgi:cysteinyl-tRNA synthetase